MTKMKKSKKQTLHDIDKQIKKLVKKEELTKGYVELKEAEKT
jgi:thiamine phosphate synthase YjbQ (UPF0047 family)